MLLGVPAVAPKLMEPREAARVLESSIKDPNRPLTIADAAAQSGLALRDADRGMHWLVSSYRGHLRVTEKGDLLFLFPTGFTRPWETRDAVSRFFGKLGRGLLGVGRFVVRAWVMIVLVGYALLFLAIVLGLTVAQQNDRDDRRGGIPGGAVFGMFFRVIADALFWTFHPWSPFAYGYYDYGYGYDDGIARAPARREEKKDETPFYEKVNRYFFGPTPPPEDPREIERRVVAEIRVQRGRIGLADVMRVTGLPREEADPMMARLMLDYDGDVGVSDDGGITYKFESIRKTADEGAAEAPPPPAWTKKKTLAPLTGNGAGANILITVLNAFNAIMAIVAINANLTLEKIGWMFQGVPLSQLSYDGVPIVLGLIPLIFSVLLFALPIGRAIMRPARGKKVARENARLAVLRETLTRIEKKQPVTDAALTAAWKQAAGEAPQSKELTREVVRLGGDAEIQESGEVRYRFADLETEAAALEAERDAAQDEERKVGRVVFASDR
jgi:hypothetical protein